MKTISLLLALLFCFVANTLFAQSNYYYWVGRGKSPDMMKNPDLLRSYTYFDVGKIKLAWWLDYDFGKEGVAQPTEKRFAVLLRIDGQAPLEFCVLDKGVNLESVNNPWGFEFAEAPQSEVTYKLSRIAPSGKEVVIRTSDKPLPQKKGLISSVRWTTSAELCEVNQVILVKLGNAYAGLQATSITQKTWRDNSRMSGVKLGGVMEYKWKYWAPAEPSTRVAQR